jgi:uncharacterized phage protein (TIGR02218 family)
LGDSACKVAINSYKFTGNIDAVSGANSFTDAARNEAGGYFDYGLVKIISGANAGITREVKQFKAGVFTSFQPWPFALAAGDNYEAIAGCDKSFDSCKNKFHNALNFRGEPHVPGTNKILETSATRSR